MPVHELNTGTRYSVSAVTQSPGIGIGTQKSGIGASRTSWEVKHTFLTSDEHGADGEDLLWVGVGRHISKSHTGETAQSKVERRHIAAADRRASAQRPETPATGARPRRDLARGRVSVILAGVPGAQPSDLWPRHVPLAAVGREAADCDGDRRRHGGQEVGGPQTLGQLVEPTWEEDIKWRKKDFILLQKGYNNSAHGWSF